MKLELGKVSLHMSEAELRRQIAEATEAWCTTSSPEDLARLHALRTQWHRMLGMEGTVLLTPSPTTSSTLAAYQVQESLTA